MRVITGKYRNKILCVPKGKSTRPTTDKIRESMFDVISSRYFIEDAKILDLFSGTGSLGIEALSRGGASAVFVEKNPESVVITRKNVSCVSEPTEVYNTDWKVAVRKLEGRKFDLIFIDPPYGLHIEQDVVSEILKKNILSSDGCIVVEHSADNKLCFDENVFSVYIKDYSGTSVTYLSLQTDCEKEDNI